VPEDLRQGLAKFDDRVFAGSSGSFGEKVLKISVPPEELVEAGLEGCDALTAVGGVEVALFKGGQVAVNRLLGCGDLV